MLNRLLLLLVLLVSTAVGQTPYQGLQSTTFSTTASSNSVTLSGSSISFHKLTWTTSGTVLTCTMAVDSSVDGSVWSAGNVIAGQTCTSPGASTVASTTVNFIRVTVTVLSGGGTVTGTWTGYTNNPSGGGGTSAGSPNDVQAAGAAGAFAADTSQIILDLINHRLGVNVSGGSLDTGIKYGPGAITYLGAFGNGKTYNDGFSHRSFADEGIWTPTSTALGMASFAAVTTLTGSNATNHYAGFESIPKINQTATLSLLYGFYDSPNIGAGATVSVRRGVDVEAVNLAGGATLGTNEGLYFAADTSGSSRWTVVSDDANPSYWVGKHAFGGANLAAADVDANFDIISVVYKTRTNCAVNSVSPAACGAAAAGAFVIPTTTTTYTVNSTSVTATSRIFLFPRTYAGDLPSAPTCVLPAITSEPAISAISAGTSFTMSLASTAGQTCWNYLIFN